MSPTATVALLDPAELAAAAALHRAAFPHYDSSRLGAGYCGRMLRAYARHPEAWVAVARSDAGPIGYLVAAPPAVQRRVNRDLRPWALLAGLRSPLRLARRALGHPAPAAISSPSADQPATTSPSGAPAPPPGGWPVATIRLVLIGVAPHARGSGAGGLLLDDFAARARAGGHRAADLSVAVDNASARRAYARHGWIEAEVEAGAAVRCRLDLADG